MGRSTRRSLSGAATVEAVIMLPVLAVLLAGVFFLGRVHDAAAGARSLARRCAWQHAFAGCGEVPDGCEDVLSGGSRARDDASREASAAVCQRAGAPGAGALRLPLIDAAIDSLIGATTQGRATRDVPLGAVLSARAERAVRPAGEDQTTPARRGADFAPRAQRDPAATTITVGGGFAALCNTQPTHPLDMVWNAICGRLGLCGD